MITKEQIEQLIESTTKELEALGYMVKRAYFSRFFKAHSCYAQTWYETGAVDFSEYFRDAPLEQIEATIMHEMCHLVIGVKPGHGKEWKEVAAVVSKAYPDKYCIKRTGSNSVKFPKNWDLRNKSLKVKFLCPCCGEVYSISENSRVLKDLAYYKCRSCPVTMDKMTRI